MKPRRAPRFWWRRHSPTGYALAPLAAIYGRISERRMQGPEVALGTPVICVGNLVVGGAGKTPTALALAEVCRQLGREPGFLSRGYRGSDPGPVLVRPELHSAAAVGDEPLLLARQAPTVVAADRPSGARLLASFGADVVIMDDGLQNPSLKKDLAIVVVDGERGIGNGLVLPAGPLRAPLKAQMQLADAVLVVGAGAGAAPVVRLASRAGLPVLSANAEPAHAANLAGRRFLAFAGIAAPDKFFRSLADAGATVEQTFSYPDHHPFSDADCEAILAEAAHRGVTPITTEKDAVRLERRPGAAERLLAAAEILPIRLRFAEPRRIAALVRDAIAAHGDAYRAAPGFRTAGATAPA